MKEVETLQRQRENEYDTLRDEMARVQLEEAKAIYTKELMMECEYWHHKAATKWLLAGDAKTKYFHSVIRQRKNFNFISRIKNEEGV